MVVAVMRLFAMGQCDRVEVKVKPGCGDETLGEGVDPFQGPKLGSCLMLGNELSKETHGMTKQEILLGKGT